MASGLRERKRDGTAKTDLSPPKEDELDELDTKKQQAELGPVDLDPDFKVVLALVVGFGLLITAFVFYKIDNRSDGPYATWVNVNFVEPIKRFATPKNRYQKSM